MRIFNESIPASLLVAFMSGLSPINVMSEEMPLRDPIPFAVYDQDGNGFVSEEEFNAVRGKRMAARTAEGTPLHGAARAPAFTDLDTSGDGQLTQDELVAGQKVQMEKRREMGMGQGRGMRQGMRMGTNMPTFYEYDLDRDGKLVEDEFTEARNKRIGERVRQGYQMRNLGSAPSFADIDANTDGEISAEEFAAHQSQRRQLGTR